MSQQITGIHIFEKRDHIEWEDELIAIQALSALTWKKYHGRIELYCNEEHLESLKKWGVDQIYDYINTDLLKEAPKNIDRNDYWTFCKIFVPSRLEPPFVLVDTDLWITSELEFDFTNSIITYHEESFDINLDNNFYSNFNHFLPEKYIGVFDDTIKPINVALLFINDKHIIDEWYKLTTEIIFSNRKTKLDKTQKTIFLEQRMLSMLLKNLKKKYSCFIPQIFNSNNTNFMDDFLWDPPVSKWSDEEKFKFNKIKHVWGLKKIFNDPFILKEVFQRVNEKIIEFNLDELGLSDVKKLIYSKIDFYESKNFIRTKKLTILYFIPNIISDSATNILIKRIESIYEFSDDVEIFVCKLLCSNQKTNYQLEKRIIKTIGTKNFIVSDNTNILTEISPDICQFETSNYSTKFNKLMEIEFEKKNYKFIKSEDGICLSTNYEDEIVIEYPKINNVLKSLSNSSDYKHSSNKLPIHIKYQQRILFGLDYNKKHILCLGNINKIPKNFYMYINEIYKVDQSIEFHFLNDLDINSNKGKNILQDLTPSTKIWLENVDLYEFLKILDLVINFDSNENTIIDEAKSYGVPSVKWCDNSIDKNLKVISSQFQKKHVLTSSIEPFQFFWKYYSFYTYFRSKQ